MNLNYIGIVAAIIAFISLALPWWTMTMSAEAMGITIGADVAVYPFMATASAMGVSQTVAVGLWFGSAALVLIVIAGVLGIVGSLMVGKKWKDDSFGCWDTRVAFDHNLCSRFTK